MCCPSGDPDSWPGSVPHCGNVPRAATLRTPLHLHPTGPSSQPTWGCGADDVNPGLCKLIQRSAMLQPSPSMPSSPVCSSAASSTAPSQTAAFTFLPQLHRPAGVFLLVALSSAPLKKRMQLCKNKAGTKQKRVILYYFLFLSHFELIKECDLNYKYPSSRMIYGLFVLDWYVLNL